MHDSLNTGRAKMFSILRTRTGFLGLGPTYGQIIIGTALEMVMRKYEEKSVVRGAEQMLDEINRRERMF